MTDTSNDVSGAEIIVRTMSTNKIDRIYIFPGGTIGPVLDIVHKWNIHIFTTRHEQGAGYAALAAARLTGLPQVVMVTSGPGATNVVTSIADAYFDSVPLVLLTGQVGTKDMRGELPVRQRGFQEVDTVAMFKPITKAQFLPKTTSELPQIMDSAFHVAKSGRPGPVLVDLPMDVQRGTINTIPRFESSKDVPMTLDSTSMDEVVSLILSSNKPVIIAGHGIILSRGQNELREFVEYTNIPISQSLLGLGVFPTSSPLSLGYHGHTGNQYANKSIHESDLLLVIGSRLDIRQTGSRTESFVPHGKVIHIELDPSELNHPRVHTEIKIHADAKTALGILNKKIKITKLPNWKNWIDQIEQWKSEFQLSYDKNGPLKPQYVIETANKLTAGKSLICVTGVGSHQQWVARHFDFDFPSRTFLTSGGHGAMGFDVPVSIGAQLNDLKKLVICFVGDGSLQMNIQELATIVSYNLPVKIIVLDNQRFGIVSQFQNITWGKDPSCGNISNPDFAKIASAYGINSATINTTDDVEPILKKALDYDGPFLVNCLVDPKEDVVPMLLGGQTMNAMWPYA